MSGTEQTNIEGEYTYVAYLTVGDDTSMQVTLDTTTHKVILASVDCVGCWTDNYSAKKYDITPR